MYVASSYQGCTDTDTISVLVQIFKVSVSEETYNWILIFLARVKCMVNRAVNQSILGIKMMYKPKVYCV